jgi:hypothetical protein
MVTLFNRALPFGGEALFFCLSERRNSMNANNNNQTNGTKTKGQLFNEAPASWNTHYLDPNGFDCQLTLRGESGSELLEKADNAIGFLLENGCTPYVFRPSVRQVDSKVVEVKNGNQGNSTNGNSGTKYSSWCSIHQCEMKKWSKDGRTWFSHKTDDGRWCRGT